VRIVIASTAHPDPSFVRRFLATEGVEVVGEPRTAAELEAAVAAARPAALVVDAEMLGDLHGVRRASAETAVIVVRRPFGDARPPGGADAYLDRGAGLVTLVDTLREVIERGARVAPVAPEMSSPSDGSPVANAPEVPLGSPRNDAPPGVLPEPPRRPAADAGPALAARTAPADTFAYPQPTRGGVGGVGAVGLGLTAFATIAGDAIEHALRWRPPAARD
jgi:hypothetical protein